MFLRWIIKGYNIKIFSQDVCVYPSWRRELKSICAIPDVIKYQNLI